MIRRVNMTNQDVQKCVLDALSKARRPRSTAAVLKWLGRRRAVDRLTAKRALWTLLDSRDLDITSDLRLVVPSRRRATPAAAALAPR